MSVHDTLKGVQQDMTEVVANLDAAKEMANKWREHSGQEIMDAWFASIPNDAAGCLLARAFNLDCEVNYRTVSDRYPDEWRLGVGSSKIERLGEKVKMRSGSSYVFFDDYKDAEKFLKLFNSSQYGENKHTVILPDEVGLVAWEFDLGNFSEYAE